MDTGPPEGQMSFFSRNFVYSSGTNDWWLTAEELRRMVEEGD